MWGIQPTGQFLTTLLFTFTEKHYSVSSLIFQLPLLRGDTRSWNTEISTTTTKSLWKIRPWLRQWADCPPPKAPIDPTYCNGVCCESLWFPDRLMHERAWREEKWSDRKPVGNVGVFFLQKNTILMSKKMNCQQRERLTLDIFKPGTGAVGSSNLIYICVQWTRSPAM